MTKPANLEYAFPLTRQSYVDAEVVYDLVAYRIVDTSYTSGYEFELDAVITPSMDFSDTEADGDGSVGQYVVFGWTSTDSTPFDTREHIVSALGWDPFDPINQTPIQGENMTTPDPTVAPEGPITNLTEDLHPYHDPNLTVGRFSGIHPDNLYPLVDGEIDLEQQKRLQARQESDRTRRVSSDDPRDPHPPFTERGPGSPPVIGVINPTAPTYNGTTHVLTVPTEANVEYYDITDPEDETLLAASTSTLTATTTVEARTVEGYRLAEGATSEWTFTYTP